MSLLTPGLDQSGIDIIGLIRIIGFEKILRQMPYLTQPSVFIQAWGWYNKPPLVATSACILHALVHDVTKRVSKELQDTPALPLGCSSTSL